MIGSAQILLKPLDAAQEQRSHIVDPFLVVYSENGTIRSVNLHVPHFKGGDVTVSWNDMDYEMQDWVIDDVYKMADTGTVSTEQYLTVANYLVSHQKAPVVDIN